MDTSVLASEIYYNTVKISYIINHLKNDLSFKLFIVYTYSRE